MTLAPLIGILLLAAPAPAQIKLASPGLSYVNLDPATGDFFLDYFAKQIELRGVRVTTNREIAALVGFERQKQLLNCGEGGSSCLAELAGALGVDGLITGSLAKVSSGYVINLKVVDNEARTLAVFSDRLRNDDALLDWLASAADKLVGQLKQKIVRAPVAQTRPGGDAPKADSPKVDSPRLTPPPPAEPEPVAAVSEGRGPNWGVWIPAAAGGLLLAGGTVSYLNARRLHGRLVDEDANSIGSYKNAEDLANEGRFYQALGFGLAGAGVVALGISGAFLFATPAETPRVTVIPTAQGATVTVGGTF